MIYYIDIDETICKTPKNRNYRKSIPIVNNVIKANKLYDAGHVLVYWTARGTKSGKDYRKLTEKQFKKWNVKYSYIQFGKPIYDVLIDDKALNSNDWV